MIRYIIVSIIMVISGQCLGADDPYLAAGRLIVGAIRKNNSVLLRNHLVSDPYIRPNGYFEINRQFIYFLQVSSSENHVEALKVLLATGSSDLGCTGHETRILTSLSGPAENRIPVWDALLSAGLNCWFDADRKDFLYKEARETAADEAQINYLVQHGFDIGITDISQGGPNVMGPLFIMYLRYLASPRLDASSGLVQGIEYSLKAYTNRNGADATKKLLAYEGQTAIGR